MSKTPKRAEMSPQPSEASAWLATAHRLADAAGTAIMPHFRRPMVVENKQAVGFDPVTIADRAGELAMREILAAEHPEHGIVGEEFDDVATAGGLSWILDPIDGTRAFIMGYPLWGTLIGLLYGNRPVVGMMDQPFTRERFWAAPGDLACAGALMRSADGRITPLSTRSCTTLADVVLATTSPDMFKTEQAKAAFESLSRQVKLTRFGGDCYAYCMVAAGQIDLVVESGLKAVDIAPLIPIVERAGGIVTSWSGGPATGGGDVIAAGDRRIHEAALRILSC